MPNKGEQIHEIMQLMEDFSWKLPDGWDRDDRMWLSAIHNLAELILTLRTEYRTFRSRLFCTSVES